MQAGQTVRPGHRWAVQTASRAGAVLAPAQDHPAHLFARELVSMLLPGEPSRFYKSKAESSHYTAPTLAQAPRICFCLDLGLPSSKQNSR